MINPKEIAEWDQSTKVIVETTPPMLFGLYKGFMAAGFSKEEAYDLTKTYLVGIMGGGKGQK